MIAQQRFEVPADEAEAFAAGARTALQELGRRPGFLRGRLTRALDAPGTWVLVTEWDSVGAYRRALSPYDVKVATAPLLRFAVDEPGAYDVVAALDEPAPASPAASARAR